MARLAPPMPYYGSKQTLGPAIAALLPEHQHYIEPYGGSLAVLLAKRPSAQETVNDLSRELMTFWRVLRDRPADLARACALTPHSRAEHDAAFAPVADGDELEIARRVWIRLAQGRSNALYCRTGWRYQVAENGLSLPGYLDAYRDRLIPAAERLVGVSLECLPALDIIARYGADPSVVFYVDPPYVLGTRNSSHYLHEMKTDDQHRELAATLNATAAAVLLSGYHSPLYSELYAGWHVHEFRMVNTQAGARSTRVEVLWSNRPFEAVAPSLFDEEVTG
ncbi:DNA adenine methylase [Streptosporangium jomthongense]|uniref:DNA adenine methylase n=1 Tax=Streptosporangium jomthongense TaxID=1193683 RepID=A0ABV8F8C8_9ACTN